MGLHLKLRCNWLTEITFSNSYRNANRKTEKSFDKIDRGCIVRYVKRQGCIDSDMMDDGCNKMLYSYLAIKKAIMNYKWTILWFKQISKFLINELLWFEGRCTRQLGTNLLRRNYWHNYHGLQTNSFNWLLTISIGLHFKAVINSFLINVSITF